MAVTNTTNTVQEAGNGVKVAFDFDFKVFQASDIEVFEIDQTTLVATEITSGFAVVINSITEGGTVTYDTAPASGKDSFIKRKLDLTQATNVNTEGIIPSNSLNNEYDRSRMIDIQQQEELDRSLKFADTSSLTGIVFPESTSASARALKIPAWDTNGTALELITVASVVATDPIAVQGDIVQGGSLGAAEKLAIGATSALLQPVAGKLAYVTNPILLIPTIADFTSATHGHTDAAGGGLMTGALGSLLSTDLTITGSAATTPDANTITKDHLLGARCTFDGTGTPAYTEEINFSGAITDNGAGNYTLTIDRDFANANYSAFASDNGGLDAFGHCGALAVGSLNVLVRNAGGTLVDSGVIGVALFGAQ